MALPATIRTAHGWRVGETSAFCVDGLDFSPQFLFGSCEVAAVVAVDDAWLSSASHKAVECHQETVCRHVVSDLDMDCSRDHAREEAAPTLDGSTSVLD